MYRFLLIVVVILWPIVAWADTATEHFTRGVELYNSKRYSEAIAEYQEAIRLNPSDASTHYNLGLALMAKGKDANPIFAKIMISVKERKYYNDAIVEYQKAIRIRPNFANAHFSLGNAYWILGVWASAVREWEETLRIEPNNNEALEWLPKARAKQRSSEVDLRKRRDEAEKTRKELKELEERVKYI